MPSLSLSQNEKRYIAIILLACVLLFSIICLAFQGSSFIKTQQNLKYIDDIQHSVNSNLSKIQYNSICVTLDQWNEILTNLHDVNENLEDKAAVEVASIILLIIIIFLVVAIYAAVRKVKHSTTEVNATTPLVVTAPGRIRNQPSFPALPIREGASTTNPAGHKRKASAAMMHEGALYEPWNQTTLDKLSSESDLVPAAKVTRAAYRYGPIAGRIMLRRFGHLLSEQEQFEVNRILNLGPSP